jgi:histidinol dehydrogenase
MNFQSIEKHTKSAEQTETETKVEQAEVEQTETEIALKAALEAVKEQVKAAKEQVKAAREANRMPKQNGIRHPKPNTMCGKSWKILDDISAKNGAPASISESMEIAKVNGLNEGTFYTQFSRWRRFHGITGRNKSTKTA